MRHTLSLNPPSLSRCDNTDILMISILIVNYASVALIRDCIKSVLSHSEGVDFEIIVADNSSQPQEVKRLQEEFPPETLNPGFKALKTVLLTENVGFGRANNAAAELAEGDLIFCLNPDTLLLNNALAILAEFLATHPKVGACGGNLYGRDMRRALSYRRISPGPLWEISEALKLHPERILFGRNTRFNRSGRPLKVGYITGADLMIRREVWEQTGGFSPEFFMFFEETDLCRRIRRLGWKIYSVPDSQIQHLEGSSFGESSPPSDTKLRFYEEGRLRYYARNLSPCLTRLCNRLYMRNLRHQSCSHHPARASVAARRLRIFQSLLHS